MTRDGVEVTALSCASSCNSPCTSGHKGGPQVRILLPRSPGCRTWRKRGEQNTWARESALCSHLRGQGWALVTPPAADSGVVVRGAHWLPCWVLRMVAQEVTTHSKFHARTGQAVTRIQHFMVFPVGYMARLTQGHMCGQRRARSLVLPLPTGQRPTAEPCLGTPCLGTPRLPGVRPLGA